MIDAAAILLWLEDSCPGRALVILVLRDALLVGGYRLLVPRGYDFEVTLLGKVATWVLYLSVGILIVVGHGDRLAALALLDRRSRSRSSPRRSTSSRRGARWRR